MMPLVPVLASHDPNAIKMAPWHFLGQDNQNEVWLD